jgi:hypothetical protein
MKTYKRVCKAPLSLGTGPPASKTKDQPVCSWRDVRTWLIVCSKQLIALQRSNISQVKHWLGICKSLTIAFTWLTLPRMLCLLPWYPLSWWPCPMHSSSFANISQPDISPLQSWLRKAVLSQLHRKQMLFFLLISWYSLAMFVVVLIYDRLQLQFVVQLGICLVWLKMSRSLEL